MNATLNALPEGNFISRAYKRYQESRAATAEAARRTPPSDTSAWAAFWEKLVRGTLRFIQGMLWIGAVVVTFGSLDDHFRTAFKNDALGPLYFEAKAKVAAVQSAANLPQLKEKAADLAVWSETRGMEYLSLKKDAKDGVFALRQAKNDIGTALTQSFENEADREFLIYRVRKAASDVPVMSMMKESPSRDEVRRTWMLAMVALAAFVSTITSAISAYLRGDKLSFGAVAVAGSFAGGAIGGGLFAWGYVSTLIPTLL